ncbi:MAG: hypothetical protein WBC78_12705 [Candidatus Sulfotelmatobacter sp.]
MSPTFSLFCRPLSCSTIRRTVGAVLFFTVLPLLYGQGPPNPDAGIQMWSSNEFGIDLATSAINIQIPIRSKLGAVPFSSSFLGTSQAYVATNVQGGNQAYYTDTGFDRYSDPTGVTLNATSTSGTCTGHPSETYTEFTIASVTDRTGAIHPLGNGANSIWKISSYCPQTPGPLVAGDGSGYTFVVTSVSGTSYTSSIYNASGDQWKALCSPSPTCSAGPTITDADGNTISDSGGVGNSVIDTLDATVLNVAYSGANPASYSYTNENLNPATQYYTFGYDSTDHFKINFGLPDRA